MGLFREVGRQVEQFKQSVTESAEDTQKAEDADFECESCGARFDTHDGECPECWSTEITRPSE